MGNPSSLTCCRQILALVALVVLAACPAPGVAGGRPAVPAGSPPPEIAVAGSPAGAMRTRSFERRVEGTSKTVAVTITASAAIDERLLGYLEQTLRIVEPGELASQELWTLRAVGEPDPDADEIAIVLEAADPADRSAYAWLPPDGFEVVRPGILRPEPGLAAGLEAAPAAVLSGAPVAPTIPELADETGRFTRLTGRVSCTALDDSTAIKNPLGFVAIEVAGRQTTAAADGTFELEGPFASGSHKVKAVFDAPVGSGSPTTRLQVMDDLHQTRSEVRTVRSRSSTADTVELGEVALTGADCELWRLGTVVLDDYHQSVGKSPPAGELRLKRWSGIWHGTPHTYYDYIVLITDFPTSGAHRKEWSRRVTLFHEFGHSIRHVADGDEFHWSWDNFRWAYARSHSGCEVFNTQYAFNEGWANYWRGATLGAPAQCDPTLGRLFLDWNEDQIGDHLLVLASTLCTPSDPPGCAKRKMVSVLETYPGEIHSIREFEVRYCELFASGNPHCRSAGGPRRAQPASCPPGFHDDGATCRLENIKAKPSYGRGVGTVPTGCGSGQELDAGLCYDRCRSGYRGVGPVCWESCAAGFRDDGAFCAKPGPYGRGAGYPWKFGDAPFDLGGARRRCERDHGAGNCEQNGLIIYPKCRSGFHNVGCCICSPNCPAGMTDIGVSCAKRSYGRGVGTVPTRCPGGKENDAGLCYVPCRSGFSGVGPVCWGRCPAGFDDHGATCYRPPNVLVKY